MILDFRVIPNASRTAITGLRNEEIVLRVNAPAREGKANRAMIVYLSRAFGVSRSAVRLLSGEKGRHKKIEIVGLDSGEIRAQLVGLLGTV